MPTSGTAKPITVMISVAAIMVLSTATMLIFATTLFPLTTTFLILAKAFLMILLMDPRTMKIPCSMDHVVLR